MPSKLIDEFVKSLCLGLEEMICCGMINLAAVGGRDMEDPIIPGEKRGVSAVASDDSEEGNASSVSNSTSIFFSNLDRAASRIFASTFEYPVIGVVLVPSGKAGASPAAIGTNLAVAAGAGAGGAGASYITPSDGSGVVMSGWVLSTGAGELPLFIFFFSSMLCEWLRFLFYSS
jgi:hypothetical protein